MAIIATNNRQAEVVAQGEAMRATVNFSGALMEMLATVYVYILMAAIRESVQNACDAAKRAGLSFADGVMVYLPTLDNPVLTVIDQGSGMTKAFMEAPDGYLSFGTSTKAGDNGAAGGLGVGRWAAYGYIRECCITTCHASDMIERTYFQTQGADNTPHVHLASEVPGTTIGTKISFPVKEADLDEALRAVAWLKEVMQLTMGDSFSVDTPALLPKVLPEVSETVLELGEVDSSLAGIRVIPMRGAALQYGRQGLQSGSLVVLTNQGQGVGGLPFHVKAQTSPSVFETGMIIEIPMSFNIPFMPSREEVKYTDEVDALMVRIDQAVVTAAGIRAEYLFKQHGLDSKRLLSQLVGEDSNDIWHHLARARNISKGTLSEALRMATGGDMWNGRLYIPYVAPLRGAALAAKWVEDGCVLRTVSSISGSCAIPGGGTLGPVRVTFQASKPFAIVVNDLPTGGTQRFRGWLAEAKRGMRMLYLTGDIAAAKEAMELINARFGNVLEVFYTSQFAEVARVVVGSKVKRSAAGSLAVFNVTLSKQATEVLSFTTPTKGSTPRVWLTKDGGLLSGLNPDARLADVMEWNGLRAVFKAMGVPQLYLLTPKQTRELEAAVADAQDKGLFDLDADEFSDPGEHLAVQALKSWRPLEEYLQGVIDSPVVQSVLKGEVLQEVKEHYEMTNFCKNLASQPRMELVGTKLDKALAAHVDVLTGELKLAKPAEVDSTTASLCSGLARFARYLDVADADSDERKQLHATLRHLDKAGKRNYQAIWQELSQQFPLLSLCRHNSVDDAAVTQLSQAMAIIYR